MTNVGQSRQARKRLATRQSISDAATALFFERGFDAVTIDEIAEAADVARMTVFNHFARKEDMFFDRENEVRADTLLALQGAGPGASVIEALRKFVHNAFGSLGPYRGALDVNGYQFMQTVQGSEALSHRARAMRDEWTQMLVTAMMTGADRSTDEALFQLAASIMLAGWTTAMSEAHREFGRSKNTAKARKILFRLVDLSATAAEAVLQAPKP